MFCICINEDGFNKPTDDPAANIQYSVQVFDPIKFQPCQDQNLLKCGAGVALLHQVEAMVGHQMLQSDCA